MQSRDGCDGWRVVTRWSPWVADMTVAVIRAAQLSRPIAPSDIILLLLLLLRDVSDIFFYFVVVVCAAASCSLQRSVCRSQST